MWGLWLACSMFKDMKKNEDYNLQINVLVDCEQS